MVKMMPLSTPIVLLALVWAVLWSCCTCALASQLLLSPVTTEAAAQDSTGKVWAIVAGPVWSLHMWQDEAWRPAPKPVGGNYRPSVLTRGATGDVLCLWLDGNVNRWALSEHQGESSRLLANLETTLHEPRLFQDSTRSIWLTGSDKNIYRIVPDKAQVVTIKEPAYIIQQEQYRESGKVTGFRYYNSVHATEDGLGRILFWSHTYYDGGNATIRGVLLFHDNKFEHRPIIEQFPDKPIAWIIPRDRNRLWLILGETTQASLYELNPQTFVAMPVPEPEPGAWRSLQRISRNGDDWFVVSVGSDYVWQPKVEAQRLRGTVWRLRDNNWTKIRAGIDGDEHLRLPAQRPVVSTPEGNWIGSSAGLIFVPTDGESALFDWQKGYPLHATDYLFQLNDTRLLGIARNHGSVVFSGSADLLENIRSPRVQLFRDLQWLVQDASGKVWSLAKSYDRPLQEWDGSQWIPHPLPTDFNIQSLWHRGIENLWKLAADSRGRLWLIPFSTDDTKRSTLIYDPVKKEYETFASFTAALEAQIGTGLSFAPQENRYTTISYGPNRRITFQGDGLNIHYFDGEKWHRWQPHSFKPGPPPDAPAFFGRNGNLSVNFKGETWQYDAEKGWQAVAYEPQTTGWFSWSEPDRVPASLLRSAPRPDTQSYATDTTGARWFASQGRLIKAWGDQWAVWLRQDENQPFIDGRQLTAAFVDHHGNAILAAGRQGREHIQVAAPSPPPDTHVKVTQDAAGTVTLEFSSPAPTANRFIWKLNNEAWSTPIAQARHTLRFLPSGSYRVQAAAIGPELQADLTPTVASFEVKVNPQAQIASIIAQLQSPEYELREAAVAGLVRHSDRSLAALRAARRQIETTANKDTLWWIDAAIQQVEDALRKTASATKVEER